MRGGERVANDFKGVVYNISNSNASTTQSRSSVVVFSFSILNIEIFDNLSPIINRRCPKCTDNNLISFRKHLALIKQHPCGTPQPRVLESIALIPEEINSESDLKIIPPFTVLHRCDSTGCCENSTMRCKPQEIEEVTVTFALLRPSYNLKYLKVNLVNHTSCSCSSLH
ncbi:platelet-derived growth factor subunit A [Anoplophora glabripennis]|nr:platelet-derived growth factor subunit A [Anoplophora glabripennis]